MKSLPTIIAAIILVVVLAAWACTFQVRSTEVAILKTFGEAQKEPITVDENDRSFFAGLHFKWPTPIQTVAKYDRRLRLLEDRIDETPTEDDRQIIVTTFTAWTISDPYKFHTQYRTVEEGETNLRNRIRSYKKAVIGTHRFSEFVSDNPEQRNIRGIEEEIKDLIAKNAGKAFGIEVKAFGIKQIGLPASVSQEVFNAMKADKEARAANFKSQGNAEGARIVAEAQGAAQRISSVVDRKVKEIQSQGLNEVGKIYAQFRAHQDLRIFLDKLRSLEKILSNRTEIFMDASVAPVDVMDPAQRQEMAHPDTAGAAK
ncbi:MAG TPA: SPFH domain-containing protein [Phycisphaerae bacterium]|nr:SPFH domain-containing protein [Phycisphaerae bacterium]